MDNVEVVDLPSKVLPTVSGKKSVICKSADGFLYCVTASGAKRLMTMDEAHEVGSHAIQFFGERTPAERYGGTWEIDAEYAGRVIIGSGGGYEFGTKGGEETHTQTVDEMPKHNHQITTTIYTQTDTYGTILEGYSSYSQKATENTGGGQPFNIMQPYFVQNIWKRVA